MWFKNLVVYRFSQPFSLSSAELESHLSNRPLVACNGFEMQTRGWVGIGDQDTLVHSLNGHHLIALGLNQKLLPASIINQVTRERAAGVAVEQGFPVGRRQMRELKDRVADELRGRALTRRTVLNAWIDAEHGWLVVDSPSVARAEELIVTLRDTLGSLPVSLLETERSPSVSMGAWLMFGEVPGSFQIEQDLELRSVKDPKSMIRYVQHPLDSKEIQKQISAGKSRQSEFLKCGSRISSSIVFRSPFR